MGLNAKSDFSSFPPHDYISLQSIFVVSWRGYTEASRASWKQRADRGSCFLTRPQSPAVLLWFLPKVVTAA